jgi:hypothetical protein
MLSQPDCDGSTDGRDDLDDGRVKAMATATTSSIPSSVNSGNRSGTGTDSHHRSRPSLFQGTRSSSDDKLSDDLLHSPVQPSRTQSQLVDTDQPISVEAAVWDWQAPSSFGAPTQLETSDQSATYFYEPQGELLLHQVAGVTSARANEFSIPGPVEPQFPNRGQPALNPLEALLASSRAPDDSSIRIGAKRKSAPDLYETATKRPTLDMVEVDRTGQRVDAQSGKTSPVADRRNPPNSDSSSLAAPLVLPARKVFPIQIGDKLFRLSGASISSDGKSMSRCSLSLAQGQITF